jgi:hypothetical protein
MWRAAPRWVPRRHVRVHLPFYVGPCSIWWAIVFRIETSQTGDSRSGADLFASRCSRFAEGLCIRLPSALSRLRRQTSSISFRCCDPAARNCFMVGEGGIALAVCQSRHSSCSPERLSADSQFQQFRSLRGASNASSFSFSLRVRRYGSAHDPDGSLLPGGCVRCATTTCRATARLPLLS